MQWKFNGQSVCKQFWCWAYACSHGTVDKYKELLKHGHCCPPAPLPKMPGRRSDTKKYEVDGYFLKLYHELGDTMAIPDKSDASLNLDGGENVLIERDHVLYNLAMDVGDGKHAVPRRYLNPGTVEALWQGYKLGLPAAQQVLGHPKSAIDIHAYLNERAGYFGEGCVLGFKYQVG